MTDSFISAVTHGPEALQGQGGAAYDILYAWQPNTLSFQLVTLDAAGALVTSGSGGGGGAVTQSGVWNVGITNASLAVTGAFYQATQPVSIDSLPAISFSAPQHVIIDSASLGTVTVTGALTDTQLRASPVPVSGTVTANVSNLFTLDTTASTGNASLASIKTDLDTVVTNTTGLSTSANQITELASLAEIALDTDNLATLAGLAAAAATIEYQRLALQAQYDAMAEQKRLRQLIAANAGGFIPMPEMFQLGAP